MSALTIRRVTLAWGSAVVLAAAGLSHGCLAAATFVAHSDGAEIQTGSLRMSVTAITDDVLRVRIAAS
ncbi:MAG: hypothetical protein M3O41_15450, partial [Pseudomonadota bacterium]|nr:hypothetical protein [Pseudomonadota bacterium]